jgi:hypothetical protein
VQTEPSSERIKAFVLDLLRQGHSDDLAFAQALTETDRAAAGADHFWSAKDHFSHRTFWHHDVIDKVRAVEHGGPVPVAAVDEDQINAQVWNAHRLRPWADVFAAYIDSNAQILTLVDSIDASALTTPGRYAWLPAWAPGYATFLGNCYEHDQEHLMQYWLDRGDVARAVRARQACEQRIIDSPLPDWVRGWFSYNTACFYAAANQREAAVEALQRATTYDPRLAERAQTDPQLAALGGT